MSDSTSDKASNYRQSASVGETGDTALELRLAITRTARTLRQEAGGGLTPTFLSALASIDRNQPVTPARLAEIEGIKRPTATRLISHLLEEGMVERAADPRDRRSFTLSLSEEGKDFIEERRNRKSAYLFRLLDELPDQDVEVLAKAARILGTSHREHLADLAESDSDAGLSGPGRNP